MMNIVVLHQMRFAIHYSSLNQPEVQDAYHAVGLCTLFSTALLQNQEEDECIEMISFASEALVCHYRR